LILFSTFKTFAGGDWKIDNTGTTASKLFVIHFVLEVATGKNIYRVTRALNKMRRQWTSRMQELAGRELWLPVKNSNGSWLSPYHPEFNFKKFCSAFRRCLACRPTFVHFCSRDGRSVEIKPCWRLHFCPFCWANLAAAHYVYLKQVIRRLQKQEPGKPYVLVSRVLRQFVPALGFDARTAVSPEQVAEYSAQLQLVLAKHKKLYAKLVAGKKFQKVTGALWRIVVIPQSNGWFVEARQMFICPPNTKLPLIQLRKASVVHMQSVKLNGLKRDVDEAVFHAFGEFCRYPRELLTGYAELVAAYLRAAHNVRLIAGRGVLRKTSRPLIRHMQERRAHAKAKAEATAARNADPFTASV
jgi:hypothetical protein